MFEITIKLTVKSANEIILKISHYIAVMNKSSGIRFLDNSVNSQKYSGHGSERTVESSLQLS